MADASKMRAQFFGRKFLAAHIIFPGYCCQSYFKSVLPLLYIKRDFLTKTDLTAGWEVAGQKYLLLKRVFAVDNDALVILQDDATDWGIQRLLNNELIEKHSLFTA